MTVTVYSRHVAFPQVAEPYNYGHEVVVDDLPKRAIQVFFGLDPNGDDAYRLETSKYDKWMVVSVESTNDGAHVDRRIAEQRDRLLSGLYPSFVSPEYYTTTEYDDGDQWNTISLDGWPS